ncbi:MAG: O-antigen ligase family protein [Candidatus Thermoplasmatota archaeon]|nr:O-antigen ligase family protein [Candidatus Thermoplasmatota archaeon]
MKTFWKVWLFLLPFFLPLYVVRLNIGPLPTTLLEIFIVVSFATWLICKIYQRTLLSFIKNSPKCRWFYPIIIWLLATLIAVLIAQDKWGALGHWRAFMLEPILVFVMFADLIPPTPLNKGGANGRWVMFGIAAVTIALGVYSIVQYFTGFGIPAPWDAIPGRRATGIFGFPNGLSLFMAPFGIACFIAWLNKVWEGDSLWARILLLVAAAFAGVAEILAQSMGGLLAFGVGIVLVLLIKKSTRKLGLVVTAIGAIAACLVGYKILSTQLRSTDLNDSLALNKRWSSMVRTVIWSESWELIKAHPLAGTGLRSYQTAIIPFHKATWMEIYPHPHNIILMLWIETGLFGLLAFAWLCVTWIMVVKKNKNWLWLVPLVVILVHGMVDMPYFKNDLAAQFWILAALATL